MKKDAILIIMVLGLLMLGACSKNTETSTTGNSDKFSGKLADIMSSGSSYKCTTMQENNQVDMYVKGEKVRSELTTPQGKVNVIADENQCVWMWQDGNSQGTKLCSETQTTEDSDAQVQGKTDPNADVECNKMVVDNSMFVPPTNVQFSDLSEMLKKFGGSTPQ
ncbi:hypothetical protein J4476_03690 [Candidatus Woesearchaeota archaeon]|nr:hypothetical protein [Candidatus Woesearchaeota archaeon]